MGDEVTGGNKKKKRARRGRGEGGVHFREDRQCWEGSISQGYDAEGRRLRKRIFGETKGQVLDEMARLRGKPAEPSEAKTMTVGRLVGMWLDSTKATTGARTHECRAAVCADHVTPHVGCVLAAKLEPLRISTYYTDLQRAGRGAGTVRHAAKALRAALEHGVNVGLLHSNPSKRVKLPPEPEREMVVLTAELMKHFLARSAGLPVHPLLCLALGTGMRRGEMLGLYWPEVDLEVEQPAVTVKQSLTFTKAGRYQLKTPKTKSARRRIALPSFAAEALRELRRRRQAAGLLPSPVFCSARGGFLNFRNVSKAFAGAVDWANDPEKGKRQKERTRPKPPPVMPEGFRFHDMRHTSASLLLSAGHSLKAVSARLGHANPALTLRIYAHVMPGDDARLAAAMDALAQ